MNRQQKISTSWLVIAIAIVIHNALEIGEALFFKELPEKPFAENIPVAVHVINVSALVTPLILGFLSQFYPKKGFKMFSFIFAILLALLNLAHLAEQVAGGMENVTQLILLMFVVVVNITLILMLNKWRKEQDK